MQKNCKNSWCNQPFDVTDEDLAFYEKVSPEFGGIKYQIPPPTLCPDCRFQRRLCFRNERSLYKRQCDLTKQSIIAMYPENSPYTVYKATEWFDDRWEPKQYEMVFDFSRTFFDQFEDLFKAVPRLALIQQGTMDNSEYCNRASNNKNCYLIFTSNFSEDCYYSKHVTHCKNCVDCLNVHKSELCYDCADCYECYNCDYLESCKNCSDSVFLKGCIGCKDCMFCTNLFQKQYCIMNEQYSEEEYRKKLFETELDRRSTIDLLRRRFEEMKSRMIVRYYVGQNNENVTGNYLEQCKNTLHSFECRETEDCFYSQFITEAKDCMDYTSWGRGCELIYETANCGYNSRDVLFSNECWDGNQNLLYCSQCMNSSHLFGCCGLRHQKYCILNKQYTKEEYEQLVPKIIEKMKSEGEWGEFFPRELSPFAYNETNAHDDFPLTKALAERQGWKWLREEKGDPSHTKKLPDTISDTSADIVGQPLLCSETGKPYKMTEQEFQFYKRKNLPPPDHCFETRHTRRLRLQNPKKLWNRECTKCSKPIATSYSPDRPAVRGSEEPSGSRRETVVCEECYLKEVY